MACLDGGGMDSQKPKNPCMHSIRRCLYTAFKVEDDVVCTENVGLVNIKLNLLQRRERTCNHGGRGGGCGYGWEGEGGGGGGGERARRGGGEDADWNGRCKTDAPVDGLGGHWGGAIRECATEQDA